MFTKCCNGTWREPWVLRASLHEFYSAWWADVTKWLQLFNYDRFDVLNAEEACFVSVMASSLDGEGRKDLPPFLRPEFDSSWRARWRQYGSTVVERRCLCAASFGEDDVTRLPRGVDVGGLTTSKTDASACPD